MSTEMLPQSAAGHPVDEEDLDGQCQRYRPLVIGSWTDTNSRITVAGLPFSLVGTVHWLSVNCLLHEQSAVPKSLLIWLVVGTCAASPSVKCSENVGACAMTPLSGYDADLVKCCGKRELWPSDEYVIYICLKSHYFGMT